MRSLTLVCLLAAPAMATKPADPAVQELTELRQQLGEGAQVVADADEFADAVQRVTDPGPTAAAPRRSAHPRRPAAVPDRVPRTSQPYANTRFPARPPHPPASPHRPKPILLRESAFRLDQIAHELEMAELFGEADNVRRAAHQLREAARKPAKERPQHVVSD